MAEVASSITCNISESIVGVGVACLLKTKGESSAELDGSSLPPLVVEGKNLGSLIFQIPHSDQQM